MSARKFPRAVPRAVQMAVHRALDVILDGFASLPSNPDDDDEKTAAARVRLEAGEVLGGMNALQLALGHDSPSATRGVVCQAEVWQLMRRVGHAGSQTGARRVFVVGSRLKAGASCANCGKSTTATFCQTCKAPFRRDRAWRVTALEMIVAGKTPSAIAAAVSQPLYPHPGDGPLVGVVAYLLGEVPNLVSKEWADGYHAVVGDGSRHTAAVGARGRQRRRRRQQGNAA